MNKFIALLLPLILLVALFFGGIFAFYHSSPGMKTHFISLPVPLGAYVNYSFDEQPYPYGVVDRDVKEKLSLDNPLRYFAHAIWFAGSGYVEYRVKNPLPKNASVKALRLFFEAGLTAPDSQTVIFFSVNGKRIGTQTIESDVGGKRGTYTPAWWPTKEPQYGKPLFVEVREDGTYMSEGYNPDWVTKKKAEIPFKKVSDVGIGDLNLTQDVLTFKIGVDAQEKGGLMLFGEHFGNYPKTVTLGLEYEGEKIYQPRIIDIINDPEHYENKSVIMRVHPGGWSCPPGRATPLPEHLSRSATMLYDDTGCLYGGGTLLVGKILSPEVHTIMTPGNETIIIEGKVRLDKNIPFLSAQGLLSNDALRERD